ncbi:putative COP9 signalosome complex subunit 2 [[Candida] jaroonii]|uniref:COP9 signalosome complex subunit 2 n=1 Tax=[Candida] jaroonii TaxID=467808 RepID=A0ACA9YCN4_9ASCO|nr:putative COP9 signalosome complex subunit 2 [[Candida] jaroonii]
MSDSDYLTEESYEFEFEDDEGSEVELDNNEDEQLQNQYYNAKAYKDDNLNLAIEKLKEITDNEPNNENMIWIYKSTKQIAKIYFHQQQFDKFLESLKSLIKLIPEVDDKSYLEESINKIFMNYTNIKDNSIVLRICDVILEMMSMLGKSNNNDRLWIKVNLNKLSILLLDSSNSKICHEIITELNQKLNEVSDITRDSFSLEVIASEIELLTITNDLDMDRLVYLYEKSTTITSPVTHPRIIGIIKECGGKIEFFKKKYENSRQNFYESFKQFDESGSIEKNKVFKYLILLSIISENEFNPFESQETQHFVEEEEFRLLIDLIEIFNDLNLKDFEILVNDMAKYPKSSDFSNDDIVIKSFQLIKDLIIDKILINLCKAYSNIKFDYLTEFLNLPEDKIVKKILKLSNSGRLSNIKINFIDRIIECEDNSIKLQINNKMILNNFKNFSALNFQIDDDKMQVDKKRVSVQDQLLFITSKNPMENEYLGFIDHWFGSIINSIPKYKKGKLSTKDKIFIEQKNQTELTEDIDIRNHLKNWCNEVLSYNFENSH